MQNKTTVEINGRLYDAKTGALIQTDHQPTPHTQHPSQQAVQQPRKQFVDGFVRGAALPTAQTPLALRKKSSDSATSASHQSSQQASHHHDAAAQTSHHAHNAPHHAIDAHDVHQKQHKSATLMRKVVKNPIKHAAHQQASHLIQPKRGVPLKAIHSGPVESAKSRLAESPRTRFILKAQSSQQSHAISHFTQKDSDGSLDPLKPIPVKLKTIDLKSPDPAALQHHEHHAAHHTAQNEPQAAPTHEVPTRNHRTHAMLQRGLMAANSHEQHRIAFKKSTRSTLVSVGAGTLAALILTGYIAYVNLPNIAMKVAASKAGFSATLPDAPSGYAMKGAIKYAPGRITFNLQSNSNDNTIAITEQSSNWDSQSLLKNHVRPASSGDYEAIEASGRTLYLYGKSVSWVHGGVWYQIDGNDQLGRDQLVKIATSM